jgi:hypothetical protein
VLRAIQVFILRIMRPLPGAICPTTYQVTITFVMGSAMMECFASMLLMGRKASLRRTHRKNVVTSRTQRYQHKPRARICCRPGQQGRQGRRRVPQGHDHSIFQPLQKQSTHTPGSNHRSVFMALSKPSDKDVCPTTRRLTPLSNTSSTIHL